MKKNNKGFTLVELIVVLVILAILAAILVPALLGYIDKAREGQYAEEAHSIITAYQAWETEEYSKLKDNPTAPNIDYVNAIVSPTEVTTIGTVYCGVKTDSTTAVEKHKKFTVAGVDGLQFKSQDGKAITCTFDGTDIVITQIGTQPTGKTAAADWKTGLTAVAAPASTGD